MLDWISFWDSKHSVYVNARHLDAHYRRIADDVLRYVRPGCTMLDYGCGEALAHELIAAVAGRLILCDAAPGVREGLAKRFAGNGKIEVRTPEEVEALAAGSLNLIVMHSVAQYLDGGELYERLTLFRRLLKPNGLLVLGDIIPPKVSPLTDALALLRFGASDGFFFAAILGLIRTAFSDYARLRSKIGITRYREAAMIERLAVAGLSGERAAANIGHNPARMTFLARRAP
jgi:SAM-dependent methyltransferase